MLEIENTTHRSSRAFQLCDVGEIMRTQMMMADIDDGGGDDDEFI